MVKVLLVAIFYLFYQYNPIKNTCSHLFPVREFYHLELLSCSPVRSAQLGFIYIILTS